MRATTILLVLPILALNFAFAGELPAAYQAEIFDAGLPPWLPPTENALRLALFGLMVVLPVQSNRAGWAVFSLGVLAYAGSWAAVILAAGSAWTQSWVGFTAPAWTPALWLTGIGLLARPRSVPALGLVKPVYVALAASFLLAHVSHATLVWARLSAG